MLFFAMKFAVLFVFHPLWRSAQDTSDPAIDGPGRFTGFAKPDHGFCGPSPSGSLGSLLGGPSGVPRGSLRFAQSAQGRQQLAGSWRHSIAPLRGSSCVTKDELKSVQEPA